MPDAVADYETAASGFAAVLAQCGDDLSVPSPCEGWTAQDVVDHVTGGAPYYAASGAGWCPIFPKGRIGPPGTARRLAPSPTPVGSRACSIRWCRHPSAAMRSRRR